MYSRNIAKLQKPINFFISQDISKLLNDLESFKQYDKAGVQRFKLNYEQLEQVKRYIQILQSINKAQEKAKSHIERLKQLYEQLREKVNKDALNFLLNFIETQELNIDDVIKLVVQQGLEEVTPSSDLGKIMKEQQTFYKALLVGQYQNVQISPYLFKLLQLGRVRYFIQNVHGFYRKQMDLDIKEESEHDNQLSDRINDLFE